MKLTVSEISEGIPSLKPLLLLVSGILGSDFLPAGKLSGSGITFILIFAWGILFLIEKKHFKHFYFSEILATLAMFSLFMYVAQNSKEEILEYPENTWLAKLESFPVEKEKTQLLELRLIGSFDDSVLFPRRTLIYAYVEKSLEVAGLDPGQVVLVHCALRRIANLGNPGEFDYASFLARKKIYYRVFLRKDDLRITLSSLHDLRTRSARIEGFLSSRIEQGWGGEEEKSVLRAIGLGDKSGLEEDQRLEYSRAGAVHIMAVSGLHVGLFWMFLGFVFKILGNGKTSRILSLIIGILVLWGYAMVTGLSPSVCRACLMFTLVNVGRIINRHSKLINTVVLSAFLLLLINPALLYELGFQFSYAAVMGIVLFQPRLSRLLEGVGQIWKYPVELVMVSLTAQVFTAPLTLFYFHSFPVYFLFTNLVIIPMVTLLMISFLLSCVFLPVDFLSYFFTSVGLRFSWLMNQIVELINKLPSPVIEGVYLPTSFLVILIILPVVLLCWLYYRRFQNLVFLLILTLTSASLILTEKIKVSPAFLGVYNLQKGPVVGLCYEDKHWVFDFYEDDNIQDDLAWAAASFWIRQKTPEPVYLDNLGSLERTDPDRIKVFDDENGFVFLSAHKRIAVIRNLKRSYRSFDKAKLDVDILVILNKLSQRDIANLPFRFESLVCPKFYADSEIQAIENENFGFELWDLSIRGAFISKIPSCRAKKRENL